ncbi:MAG: hypothetical protein ACK521_07210 [bacterium]|jgi:hypothetical protein
MKSNKRDEDHFAAFCRQENIIEKPFQRKRNDTINEESFEESESSASEQEQP